MPVRRMTAGSFAPFSAASCWIVVSNWNNRLRCMLSRTIVELHFTVQRDGEVLDARIGRSSGHAALDQAVLAMIERAVPLPPFPPEMGRDRIDLVVPIRFFLR